MIKTNKNIPNLIGISGKMGSGKDTVGEIIRFLTHPGHYSSFEDYLQNSIRENSGWKIKKFAGKVKQILSILTGIPIKDFEKEEVKNSYLGEEWNRYSIIRENGKRHLFFPATKEFALKQKALFKNATLYEERITIRSALQQIGTGLFRDKFHKNTWTNALFSEYKTLGFDDATVATLQFPSWIITDVRFENECQAILDRKGILIRVNRGSQNVTIKDSGIIKPQLHTKNFPDMHSSETSLDMYKGFSYIINNNGSIEELIQKIKEMLIKEKLI